MKKLTAVICSVLMLAGCGDNELNNKLNQVMEQNSVNSYHLQIMSRNKDKQANAQTTNIDYRNGHVLMEAAGQKNSISYIANNTRYTLAANRVTKRTVDQSDYDLYKRQMDFLKTYSSHFNVATEEQRIVFTSNRYLLEDKKAMAELNLRRTAVDEFSVEYVFDKNKHLKTYTVERMKKNTSSMHETVYQYSKINQLKQLQIPAVIAEAERGA